MLEKDRNCVFRLEREGRLDKKEPNLKNKMPELYAEVMIQREKTTKHDQLTKEWGKCEHSKKKRQKQKGDKVEEINFKPLTSPVTFSQEQINISTDMQANPDEDLKYGRVLDEGGFGIVYAGTWHHSEVAIKKLKQQKMSEDALSELQQEATVMTQLHNPHIIHFYGFCFDAPNYAIVMEYIAFGSLYDLLHSKEEVDWLARIQLGIDVGAGLTYLHHQEILHRDLKSLNVLLDQKGTTFRGKLTDFGLAKIKTDSKLTSTKTGKGTLSWMAPELFARRAIFGKASDVYSYAVVLWELAARAVPFSDAHDPSLIPMWVERGEREDIPKETPPSMAALIEKCWVQRAEDRPSAEAVVEVLQELNVEPETTADNPALFSYRGNFSSMN